jgi:serine/threonine protein kinase
MDDREVLAAGGRNVSGRDPEFDYYEVSSVLGEGGMGIVYKARDRRTGLPVAVKVMSKRFNDPDLQFRFVRENEILASLNHRNIVRCYDVTRARDGTPSLVMEFVDGVDFRSFEGLPFPELLPLMLQTLLGMRYLRVQNIVHRDLSSNNILVCLESESRLVKIVDFGIAKILYDAPAGGDVLTQTGQFLGKFSFASPELLLGSPFDWKSDVYSLGVIFYRLLTGLFPVKVERSGNYFEWVMAHQRQHEFDFVVPEGCPPLPPELSEAVRRMLAKDPDDRPGSWEELIATFDSVQRTIFAKGLAPNPSEVRLLPPKRAEPLSSRPGHGTPADPSPKGTPGQSPGPCTPARPVVPVPSRHTPSYPIQRSPHLPSDDIPTARADGPRPPGSSLTPAGPTPEGSPPAAVPGPRAAVPAANANVSAGASGRVPVLDPDGLQVESGSLTEMVAKPQLRSGAHEVVASHREEAPPRREVTPPRREVTPPRREPTPGRIPEIPGRVLLTPPQREMTPRRQGPPGPPALPGPVPARPAFEAEGPHRMSGPIVRPRPQTPIGTGRPAMRSRGGSVPVIVHGKRPGWAKIAILVIVILGVFAAVLSFIFSLLTSADSSSTRVSPSASLAAVASAFRASSLEG